MDSIKNKTLALQILFVLLAFISMVLLSFFLMSGIVREHLVENADEVMDELENRVSTQHEALSTTFLNYTDGLLEKLLASSSEEELQSYVDEVARLTTPSSDEREIIKSLYVVLLRGATAPSDIGTGESDDGFSPSHTPILISTTATDLPSSSDLTSLAWYQSAVAAQGLVIETVPSRTSDGETIFTFARALYDENGTLFALACMNVNIESLGKDIVETALNQGGYGMLLNQNKVALFHPNQSFEGTSIDNPSFPPHIFAEALYANQDINEQPIVNYQGEDSVAFFRHLHNGWYIGLVTASDQYYASTNSMAILLGGIGVVFATILIILLVRLEMARAKSDFESQRKSIFLANMSHEIRTPLNAIVGMSAIGRTAETTERKDYCLSRIDSASQHLLGVINDILDISKIEANKIELTETNFNFENMLQQVLNMMAFHANNKDHRFTVHIDSAIPRVLCADEQRLTQVVANLLSNAVKFTAEDGEIGVEATLLGEHEGLYSIEMRVSDNGIGINKEHLERLFEPFQQAEGSITRRYGGTGLGLAISKSIVEMMGGTIRVESELGRGTTIIFMVKLRSGDEAALSAGDKKAENREGDKGDAILATSAADISFGTNADLDGRFVGHCILLVDDVEMNREMIQLLLESSGLEIDYAQNGAEAVEMFTRSPQKYDLIFMDIQMPEMDGYEATRQIRALGMSEARTIPIVAMTANAFKEDVENSLAAGMTDHLSKPVVLDSLFATLFTYLRD